ncbi:hypothetical protein [Yersinia similis]|nr:hypothetical protein [Yersinia similis]
MGTIQITLAPERYKLDEEEGNYPYLLILFGCITVLVGVIVSISHEWL